jgi:hypothetical protein
MQKIKNLNLYISKQNKILRKLTKKYSSFNKKINKEFNKIENCSSGEINELDYLIEETKQKIINNLLIVRISDLLDTMVKRDKNQIYNVSKIEISSKLLNKLSKIDKKYLKKIYKDIYKKRYIENSIYGNLFFDISLKENSKLEFNEIIFNKDYLIEKRNI